MTRLMSFFGKTVSVFLLLRFPLVIAVVLYLTSRSSPSGFIESVYKSFGYSVEWHKTGKILVEILISLRASTGNLYTMIFLSAMFVFLDFLSFNKQNRRALYFVVFKYTAITIFIFYIFCFFYVSYQILAVISFSLLFLILANAQNPDIYSRLSISKIFNPLLTTAFFLLPLTGETVFPSPFYHIAFKNLGVSEKRLRQITNFVQTVFFIIVIPVSLWLPLSYINMKDLYFKALEDFSHGQAPRDTKIIYSSWLRSDLYQIIVDDESGYIFLNCSQTRNIVILKLDQPGKLIKIIPVGVRFYDMTYNPKTHEIFYYDNSKNQAVGLKVSDPDHIEQRRSKSLFPMYEEHCCLNLDEEKQKIQFITFGVDRRSYTKVAEIDINTMQVSKPPIDMEIQCREIMFDKKRRFIYLSYHFISGVKIFNIDTWEHIGTIDINNHNGQMAMSYKTKEVIMANAADNCLHVFDAETFLKKRKIKADYGIRSVAVDEDHGIVFTSSVITGNVYLSDLKTGKLLHTYKGFFPWFRKIAVSPKRKKAIIGTWQFLYELGY